MYHPRRWPWEAWIPIGAGLAWLWCAAQSGLVGLVFALLPGGLLVSAGLASFLWPGDRRTPQFAALGGLLGALLALPFFFSVGVGAGLGLLAISVASFVVAGGLSVSQEPPVELVPTPEPSLRLSAQVAGDEALLATIQLHLPMSGGQELSRIRRDVEAARELYHAKGWLEEPLGFHATPPPLKDPQLLRAESRGLAYEHLRFESEYEPHAEEPGRERWLSYRANRTAHAWVLRHADASRPWLVCIHGFQMGWPLIDLAAFRARELHQRHGLNLLLPVLPLHGPRKAGKRSGDGFLSGDLLDTVHAEAQAMWDARRLLSWVRSQGASVIGVYGLSLGGYNAALLASLDDELACAVAGIPAVDIQRLIWRHAPPLQIRQSEHEGLTAEAAEEVLSVVSPLALVPRVPREGRRIFGAVADRLVPPDQVRDLWRHWERPKIVWYQGAHLTFGMHPEVQQLVMEAFGEAGLLAGSRPTPPALEGAQDLVVPRPTERVAASDPDGQH